MLTFLTKNWFEPVENAPLIVFRYVYGLILTAEAFGALATGWVRKNFIEPNFTFNFIGFDFLQLFVGTPMYFIYALMGVLGLLITFGVYYRVSMTGFAILWTITYLSQKTSYNNHYYLMFLLNWAMVFLPAHRYSSFDVKRNPEFISNTCPRWCIAGFMVLFWIIYTYASIAKMHFDWINAEPISIWFTMKANLPIIGPFLQYEWLQYTVAWSGICFDLLIVPMLLWRRTRWIGVGLSIVFHLFNSIVFQIGTFPYLMLGALVLFFPPETVRQWFFKHKIKYTKPIENTPIPKVLAGILLLFFTIQLTLPLRHLLYPGNVSWTEEGHRLSWRMMLRSKSGSIYFKLKDNQSGRIWTESPRKHLTSKQVSKLSVRPGMIWQYVQFLKKDYAKKGITDLSIFAISNVSLNFSGNYPMIKPEVDLAKVQWHPFKHDDWITDLEQLKSENQGKK